MRKYLEKRENGAYYIAEGYNEKQMVAAGFILETNTSFNLFMRAR